jgi:hypothetical protein
MIDYTTCIIALSTHLEIMTLLNKESVSFTTSGKRATTCRACFQTLQSGHVQAVEWRLRRPSHELVTDGDKRYITFVHTVTFRRKPGYWRSHSSLQSIRRDETVNVNKPSSMSPQLTARSGQSAQLVQCTHCIRTHSDFGHPCIGTPIT